MIQQARDRGQDVTADMYPYLAGATRRFQPAALGGRWRPGQAAERLRDPAVRQRIKTEMSATVGAHLGESLS